MSLFSGAIQSLLLGFSTGSYCAMYCAPVLIPFVCGTDNITIKKTVKLTSLFLSGRLVTYIVSGIVFASVGMIVSSFFDPVFARRLSVIAYILCGCILLANALPKSFTQKECNCTSKINARRFFANDYVTAALAGLSVGLHICPAYWATLFLCASSASITSAIVFFVCFYLGTLPFFIPVLGLPFLVKKLPELKRISQITQLLIAVYFIIFAGIIPLFFGA